MFCVNNCPPQFALDSKKLPTFNEKEPSNAEYYTKNVYVS